MASGNRESTKMTQMHPGAHSETSDVVVENTIDLTRGEYDSAASIYFPQAKSRHEDVPHCQKNNNHVLLLSEEVAKINHSTLYGPNADFPAAHDGA